MRCNNPNSPDVSHHCEASFEKCEISEAFIVENAEGVGFGVGAGAGVGVEGWEGGEAEDEEDEDLIWEIKLELELEPRLGRGVEVVLKPRVTVGNRDTETGPTCTVMFPFGTLSPRILGEKPRLDRPVLEEQAGVEQEAIDRVAD